MKKNGLTFIILLLLSMSFITLAYAGPNENAGIRFDLDATTYGNQNDTTIPAPAVGDYIRVDVYAINVHNLDTYEFEVIYDQTELSYVASSATNPITYEPNILTTNGGQAIGWMIDTSTPGVLSIAYTLAGTDTLEAPEGEGLIADIVFLSLVTTHGTLSFGDVHFFDSFTVMDIITDKGIAILYEFGNIDGTVTNSNTGESIEHAIVSIGDFSDTTGTDGTYFLEYVPIGIHDITCTAEGYYDTVDVVEVLEGQTVTIDFALEPLPRGMLDGTVTDANNGEPIEDALITATSQGKVEYTGFTNVDGYYIIDSLIASEIVGNYMVFCDGGTPYTLDEVTGVEITEDDTTTVDFVLTAPVMWVDPIEIFPIVEIMGDSTTVDITFSNIGTAPFDWRWSGTFNWNLRGTSVGTEQLREPLKIEFPTPSLSNFCTPTKVAPSLGSFPEGSTPEINHINRSEPVINLTRGSTGWAYDTAYGEYFYSFDTDDPGTANIIAYNDWKAYAGDFGSGLGNDATYYIIKWPEDIFARVDIETGIATDIGPITGSDGYMWTGISCDKSTGIMYAVETYIDTTKLYTIDLATGTPTLIGVNEIPSVIDIAVDGEGIIWGYSVTTDYMYTIDPATAVGTMVGPIGFDATCAQGMSWDPETDQVYLTAALSTMVGEFRVLNRETGHCAYVGPLPNNDEVCALGFRGGPWVTVEPTSGTIEPGSDEIVHATVYWLEKFLPGEERYANIVFTPDPDCGEQTVNVTSTFGPTTLGSISGLVTLENTPCSSGNVEDVFLTAVSQAFPNNYYTVYPDSTGEYTIQGIYPDTYDVTATLVNYEDTTIVDVVVLENQNTTNIDFEMNCLLGALQGTVTDGYGEPIEGAELTVIVDINQLGRYVVYTDSSGYYEINPMIAQEYDLTCFAAGFVTYTAEIEVIPDAILIHDIIMGNSTIDVTPPFISITLAPNTQGTEFLTVSNDGNAPLEWYANIEFPEALIIDIPPNSGDFPQVKQRPSTGIDLGMNNASSLSHSEPSIELLRGSTAWFRGSEYTTFFYGTFDTDTPGTMNEILSPPAWPAYCGDYSTESDDYFYINNPVDFNTYTVDAASGIATSVGYTGLHEFLNGMACDKTDGTMYAVTNNNLYTIDLTTGAATLVGPIGNSGTMITLACDGNGDLWGIDLILDTFWWIDKTTGAGTEIGPTGFACNYAQSMAWDPETDVIFWAAYCTGLDGNLRVIDKTTGNSAFVDDFEGGREVTLLAFPGDGQRWISIEPSSGTVPPGGDSLVTVYFDDTGLEIGTIKTADIYFFSIPDVGNQIIPVTLTVDDIGVSGEPEILITELLGNFPNPFSLFTTIRFSLKEAAHVKLSVYNIRGQLVNRLIDEDMVAGADYQVKWDGTSNDKKLTNGIYFYKFETGNKTFLEKIILMR